MAPIRLLLVNPRFPGSFWSFDWTHKNLLEEERYPVAPLGLASIAALTPEHWDVTVVDENVEEIDFDLDVDVVGVAGMSAQYARQHEILSRFREKGRYVVAGGNHASLLPGHYEGVADTVVSGEAEHIWPEFCRDFEGGEPRPLYRETGDVDLADCPVPRFDLLKSERYSLGAIQFSRGCPYRCEFCDIIVVFGRKPRTKPLVQVEAELDAMREEGIHNVFFVDDNLVGHRPKAKELLRFLGDYQERHGYPFHFGTEATVNIATDVELLELAARANFTWLFLGIESPSEEALKETLKFQNTGLSLLDSVRKIQEHGMDVYGGFIVGFDADDASIFDRQFAFIQEAGITVPMVGLLTAIPRTPLYDRLKEAGRLRLAGLEDQALLHGASAAGMVAETNVIPLKMSYPEMIRGYAALLERLWSDRAVYERLENRQRRFRPRGTKILNSPGKDLRVSFRLLLRGILPGGPVRWWYFLRSLLLTRGKLVAVAAVMDYWVMSLSLQDYARRQIQEERIETSISHFEHEREYVLPILSGSGRRAS